MLFHDCWVNIKPKAEVLTYTVKLSKTPNQIYCLDADERS